MAVRCAVSQELKTGSQAWSLGLAPGTHACQKKSCSSHQGLFGCTRPLGMASRCFRLAFTEYPKNCSGGGSAGVEVVQQMLASNQSVNKITVHRCNMPSVQALSPSRLLPTCLRQLPPAQVFLCSAKRASLGPTRLTRSASEVAITTLGRLMASSRLSWPGSGRRPMPGVGLGASSGGQWAALPGTLSRCCALSISSLS